MKQYDADAEALAADVTADFFAQSPSIRLLGPSFGKHLRAELQHPDGRRFVLKERPTHLQVADWQFHQRIPVDPEAPPVVPRPLPTLAGDFMATRGERQFEVIQWLPGRCAGLHAETDLFKATTVLANLHNWLFDVPYDSLPERTVATTNDWDFWSARLRRSPSCQDGIAAFLERADGHRMDAPKDPVRLVQGDYHNYNLLWQDDEIVGVLDWEDAHLNAPFFDMAYLITHAVFVHWPERTARGQDAWIRSENREALIGRLLAHYRRQLTQPLAVDGLASTLVTAWVVTFITTVLRGLTGVVVTPELLARAEQVIAVITAPENVTEWQNILSNEAPS